MTDQGDRPVTHRRPTGDRPATDRQTTGGRPASLVFDADGTVRIMGDVVITGQLTVEEHKIRHGPLGKLELATHKSLEWMGGDSSKAGKAKIQMKAQIDATPLGRNCRTARPSGLRRMLDL